jgi:hypothetical protein
MADENSQSSNLEAVETNGIDQIRDIILGEQMLAWEQRFSKLEDALSDLRSVVEAGLARIEKQVGDGKHGLVKNTQDLRSRLDKDQQDFRALLSSAREELEVRIAELTEKKVDRDSIGEVFIQWGQRVKTKE